MLLFWVFPFESFLLIKVSIDLLFSIFLKLFFLVSNAESIISELDNLLFAELEGVILFLISWSIFEL